MKLARLIACVAVAAVACSCAAPLHKRSMRLDLRPTPLAQSGVVAEGADYYASAVSAIEARDYVRALDLLQMARAKNADDPATLNAFGVVYDKLGRLDLSARYYAQAAQLDPGSKIVRQNMAYSEQLRFRSNGAEAIDAAVARATPEPAAEPVRQAAAVSSMIQVRVAGNGVLLIGHGVKIADASGSGLGEVLRAGLAKRGWTVRSAPPPRTLIQPHTTLTYPQGGVAVATALARSLHSPVRMSACQDNCGQITLVVGQDARRSSTRGGA